MPFYEVVTESGADYWIDTEALFWSHRQLNVDRLWNLKSALTDNPDLPWITPDEWETVTAPVVGRRMYVSSRDYWRLTTPVVSVREADKPVREEEDD